MVFLACAALAATQQDVRFSNWRFQLSPFWLQSNQGPNLILTPYEQARARNSRCEVRPGVRPNQPLDAWFSAEWVRILAGRTPAKDWGRRPTVFPRGIAGLQQQADFREANGNVRTVKLVALNPAGSINSILYTADDATSSAVSLGGIDGILGTVQFDGPPTAVDTTPIADPTPPSVASTELRQPPATPTPAVSPPPVAGPVPFEVTPTPGLGSPSAIGPDLTEKVDWDGPDVMVRSPLDIKVVTYEELKRSLASVGLHSSVAPRALTYEQAMANLARLFAAPDAAKMLSTIRTERKSSAELQAEAFMGAVSDSSGYMLGCLMLAVEKSPGDPTALFNLAGALAQLGYPNEALAVLQRLDSTGKLPVIAFGYDAEASVLYVRGYALMLIGKLAEAKTALEKAVAKAPTLTEAQYTLAIVKQALHEDPRKPLVSAVWRNNRTPMYCGSAFEGDPLTEDKAANIGMPIDELVDMSKGKDRSLPSNPHPANVEQLKALLDRQNVEDKRYEERERALNEQSGVAYHKAVHHHAHPTLKDQIDSRICDLLNPALVQLVPLQALSKEAKDRQAERMDASKRVSHHQSEQIDALIKSGLRGEAEKARARAIDQQAMNDMRMFVQAEDLARRRYFKAWYKYATALAALITDPDWKQYADLRIKILSLGQWRTVRHMAVLDYNVNYSTWYNPQPAKGMADTGDLESDELGECSESAKNRNLEWKLFDELHVPGGSDALPIAITAKMNCDEATFEIEGKFHHLSVKGFLETSASAEISKNRKGDITIFLGPKVSVGNPMITTGANAKAGGYVTIEHGKIVDMGVKEETYVTQGVVVGAGRVDQTLRVSEEHYSFFPAPPPPSKYGLTLWPNQ